MSARITTDVLAQKAGVFFATVTKVLVERDQSRGDAYLDMDLENFHAFIWDKCARVKATLRNCGHDLRTKPRQEVAPRAREDLADSVLDIAGYAALLAAWLIHHGYLSEEDLAREVPPNQQDSSRV